MDSSRSNVVAVGLAALLHLGLIAFLLLATLSCNTWARLVGDLHLPDGWNPVTCSKPLTLPGPVIQASLMGPTGAPLPPPSKHKAKKATPPPPPKVKPTVTKPKPEPVKTLPPPPQRPDVKEQQKVAAAAQKQAQQAKREQEQREKQHMSELKAQQQAKLDKLFKQMDQAKNQARQADRQSKLEQQKLAQLKDLKKSQSTHANVPKAEKARSGTNGPDQGLQAQWLAAIQSAVTQAWLRPDNIPAGVVCKIDITQIPGGQVIDAHVESSCPYDQVARRSVENAVMRAQPLPYHGFEKVFQRQITLNFKVNH